MVVDGDDVVSYSLAHFFRVAVSQGREEDCVPGTKPALCGRVLFAALRVSRVTLPGGIMDPGLVHNHILAGGVQAVVAKGG